MSSKHGAAAKNKEKSLRRNSSRALKNRYKLDLSKLSPGSRKHILLEHERVSARAARFGGSVTLKAKEIAAKRRALSLPVYDFGLGETKGQLAAEIRDEGTRAFKQGSSHYLHPAGLPELREAVLDWLGVRKSYSSDNVVITVGVKQAVFNTVMAVCNPGDVVLIDSAPWVSYEPIMHYACAVAERVRPKPKSRTLKITAEDLESAIINQPAAKMFLLNSPCNPTGQVYSQKEVDKLLQVCVQHKIYFVLDRIYWRSTFDSKYPEPKITDQSRPWLIQLDGLSKNFRSCGGLRVGWSVAAEDISLAMTNIQSHCTSGTATPSQFAAAAALRASYDRAMVEELQRKRELFSKHAAKLPLVKALPTKGTYYSFWDIRSAFGKLTSQGKVLSNSQEVADYLANEYGVITVAGSAFKQEGYLRLSFHIDDEVIVEGLEQVGRGFTGLVDA